MLITADKDVCIGAGQCVATAPDVFDQDGDGVVEVLTAEPGPDRRDAVRHAARTCPVRAIDIEVDEDQAGPA
jgi:ferredoxin